ncbi:MAG: hypothetical protein N2440_02050 [Actinobacteria bacterium]|nr:hypothetical protein [Actinomycetota bacterium]
MKCFICKNSDKQVLELKEFGAHICNDCIPEFISRRVISTIRSHRMVKQGQKVALGFSGGKDSTTLLSVFKKAEKKIGVKVIPFHLHLGFGSYSDSVLEKARKAAEKIGTDLKVYYLEDYSVRIEPIGSFPACAVCGAIKRNIFNRIARDLNCNVLATAHTFDDIFLFTIKNFISKKDNIPASYLVSSRDGIPIKIKPLYRIPESLTKIYCDILGLDYVSGECPVSDKKGHSLKSVFSQIDEVSPGMRRQILDNFKRIYKKVGKKQKDLIFDCKICGEPSTQEICALCRVRAIQSEKKQK